MNLDIFERKTFLDNNLMNAEYSKFFKKTDNKKFDTTIVQVKFLRATVNEAAYLKLFLDDLILSNRTNIVLDLSRCEYIDSTFLSTIISLNKMLNISNGFIKLVISNKRQFSILQLTKMNIIFNIHPNLKSALNNN